MVLVFNFHSYFHIPLQRFLNQHALACQLTDIFFRLRSFIMISGLLTFIFMFVRALLSRRSDWLWMLLIPVFSVRYIIVTTYAPVQVLAQSIMPGFIFCRGKYWETGNIVVSTLQYIIAAYLTVYDINLIILSEEILLHSGRLTFYGELRFASAIS